MNYYHPIHWQLAARALERIASNQTITWTTTINAFNSFLSSFDSKRVPKISICEYMEEFYKYAECSNSCFIIAFIYIKRALASNPSLILSRNNIYKLILASILLAIKYNDDEYGTNDAYGMLGGVNLEEINKLERRMLELLQFRLHVSSELYEKSIEELKIEYNQFLMEEIKNQIPKSLHGIESKDSLETFASEIDIINEEDSIM